MVKLTNRYLIKFREHHFKQIIVMYGKRFSNAGDLSMMALYSYLHLHSTPVAFLMQNLILQEFHRIDRKS